MHLRNVWPLLIILLMSGCSLQQQSDRAERIWLKANSIHSVLHDVRLQPAVTALNDVSSGTSFYSASGAATYLRGNIQSPQVRELSGLAAILGERDKYWAINDSGNQPQLFALDGNGAHLAAINLPLRNRDWEDLSSYAYNGENWVAVAETGDNVERHRVSTIYIFKQPDLNNLPSELELFKRIDFTYQDGRRNVESMAVSPNEGKIYLIAKDGADPGIYTLPLVAGHHPIASEKLIATRVGQLAELYPTKDDVWWERLFAARILYEATAADISADNRTAVVANYRHVYLFKRRSAESWADAFSRKPEVLSSHRVQQSEAVVFSAGSEDGTEEVIVSSEGVNAPLLAIQPSFSPATASVSQ